MIKSSFCGARVHVFKCGVVEMEEDGDDDDDKEIDKERKFDKVEKLIRQSGIEEVWGLGIFRF